MIEVLEFCTMVTFGCRPCRPVRPCHANVTLCVCVCVLVPVLQFEGDVLREYIASGLSVVPTLLDGNFSGVVNRLLAYDTAAVTTVLILSLMSWSFFSGAVLRDSSAVDRAWSIAPMVYAWIHLAKAGTGNHRALLAAVCITLWGIRLSYNFWRKGGYVNRGCCSGNLADVCLWMPGRAFVLGFCFFPTFEALKCCLPYRPPQV